AMNMRKISVLSLCLFVCILQAFSQQKTGSVSGTITDASNKGIAGASVSLHKVADSALVKVALSNKEGKYEFEKLEAGEYFVSTSAVGYETAHARVNVGNAVTIVEPLRLQEAAKSLGGVTITAKKPFIETKIDKTIVNVDASP